MLVSTASNAGNDLELFGMAHQTKEPAGVSQLSLVSLPNRHDGPQNFAITTILITKVGI